MAQRTSGWMARLLALVVLILLLVACQQSPSIPQTPGVLITPTSPPASPTPTFTPTPNPTTTPSPSPTATVTTSPTPTPSPESPHPLSIEFLRQQTYLGEGLTIERTLEPGANYDRYIASYLSEGNKLFALLTMPRGEKPVSGWPVILFNHGYIPPKKYRTTERYETYVDAFARNGYIVFRPDYRGHGDSEGEPVSAYLHPGYVIDVLNATAAMKNFADADPNRIGMWGHSQGGFITLRAMVVDAAIRAGVIWAGAVASYPDMLEIWTQPQYIQPHSIPQGLGRWRQEMFNEHGTPAENPGFWQSISANSYLTDLSGPVQIHHGDRDADVPVEFSRILETQIRDAGGTVEYYEWAGADHNISQSFSAAMQHTLDFFDRYVKGSQP